jgi:membrane fusion protein
MESSYFRKVVLENYHTQIKNNVLLRTPQSFHWKFIVSAALLLSIFAFIFLGSVNQKELVFGYVDTVEASAKITALNRGLVSELLVSEGDKVSKGQVIATIDSSVFVPEEQDFVRNISSLINEEISSIEVRAVNEKSYLEKQFRYKQSQFDWIAKKQNILEEQTSIHRNRMSILRKKLKENESLLTLGSISKSDVLHGQEELMSGKEKSKSLENALIDQELLKLELTNEVSELHYQYKNFVAQLSDEKRALKKQLVNFNKNNRVSLIATTEGYISNLQIKKGQIVNKLEHIADIFPTKKLYELVITAPSSTIAHIKANQEILIKYEPFPQQKFGLFKGKITSIPKSPTYNTEFLHGVKIPGAVYLVKAKLNDEDEVRMSQLLKKGMKFTAVIVTNERTVLKRLFVPFESRSQ